MTLETERPISQTNQDSELEKKNAKKANRRTVYTVGGVVVAAAASGAVAFALSNSPQPDTEQNSSTNSGSGTSIDAAESIDNLLPSTEGENRIDTVPIDRLVTLEGEFTATDLQIPAGLDSVTLGHLVMNDRFTVYNNSGSWNGLEDLVMSGNDSWETIEAEFVQKNAELVKGMFTAEALEDSETQKFLTSESDLHAYTIAKYATSKWGESGQPDSEGFRVWREVQAVYEIPDSDPNDNKRSLQIDYYLKDSDPNNAMNNAIDQEPMTAVISFEQRDNIELITRAANG